jgi:transposase
MKTNFNNNKTIPPTTANNRTASPIATANNHKTSPTAPKNPVTSHLNTATTFTPTLFVGIDIAKRNHCATAQNNCNNFTPKPFFFTNDKQGFEKLLNIILRWKKEQNCQHVVFAMEPTGGYWLPLFHYLKNKNFEVHTVSSVKVNHSKDILDNSPLKSDKKDALVISELLKNDNVLSYQVPSDEIQQVKNIMNYIEQQQEILVVYTNRLESLLSIYFPEINVIFKKLNCFSVITLLKKYTFPEEIVSAGLETVATLLREASHGQIKRNKAERLMEYAKNSIGLPGDFSARLQIENCLNFIELEEKSIESAKKLLKEVLSKIPQAEIIDSIPGVGLMVTGSIVASLGDLKNYDNVGQVLKMAGLSLSSQSSGSRRGKDRIIKRGNSMLRKYLYMSSLSHTYGGRYFYDKYISMVNKGKPKKVILVAIMRKILKISYALVKGNRKFDKNYGAGA